MNNQREFQQNMVMGSGLTRYRSAPSSYFSTLLNSSNILDDDGFGEDELEHLFNPRASSPETQKFFSRFMNNSETIQENCSSNMKSQSQINPQYPPPRKSDSSVHKPRQKLQRQQNNDFSSVPHMMYQIINSGAANSDMQDSDYGLMGSLNSNSTVQMKTEESVGGASLIRQRSSPAGLFENIINIKNELGAANLSPVDYKTAENSHGEGRFGENRDKNGGYSSGFTVNSWDDSVILPDSFFKGLTDNHQSIEGGSKHTIPKLSHHLSLPKNSAELLAMMQDSVPCKIRAKRGFATHPRSIAERVRRTKISERMRKLQDLVPNMEKQTNTSDMLDLAVDYIKDLQRQVKVCVPNCMPITKFCHKKNLRLHGFFELLRRFLIITPSALVRPGRNHRSSSFSGSRIRRPVAPYNSEGSM